MIAKNTLSEEIAIVGWRHGKLSDKMTPFFEGESMELKDLEDVLYDGKVYLKPVNNKYDENAVGVFTVEQKHLGYVWAGQATALRSWMEENGSCYLVAFIERADKVAEIFMAVPKNPLHLNLHDTLDRRIDKHWAENLPDRISSVEAESHSLGMSLLCDALKEARKWSPLLQIYIENALTYMLVDYSANRYMEVIEVYNMMSCSEIAEVRQYSGIVMKKLVKRGNKQQIQWWVNEWLPSLFRQAAEEKLLEVFVAAGYTLERVESLLRQAPEGLFYLYKCDRIRFAKKLLYSCLPIYIYNRLLTLLAVRELMLGKQKEHKKEEKEQDISTPCTLSKSDELKASIGNVMRELCDELVIKRKYDFTWLMMIMNERDELPSFDTPTSFVEYLAELNLGRNIPSRSSVSKYYEKARGQYPNWNFDDADERETTRRNNVAKRFLILLSRDNSH